MSYFYFTLQGTEIFFLEFFFPPQFPVNVRTSKPIEDFYKNLFVPDTPGGKISIY